jgi:hypothetical protein
MTVMVISLAFARLRGLNAVRSNARPRWTGLMVPPDGRGGGDFGIAQFTVNLAALRARAAT